MTHRPDLQNIEDAVDGADGTQTDDASTVEVEMNGFAIFDEDDLSNDAAEPWAVFRTEQEARGYLLMLGEGGCATPVIRPVSISGTTGPSPTNGLQLEAEQLVKELFSDLDDRSGFDTGGLDAETLAEWKAKWAERIVTAFQRMKSAEAP